MDAAAAGQRRLTRYGLPVVVAAMLVALYLPTLLYLVQLWYDTPVYTHGFLVIPLILFLVWRPRVDASALLVIGVAAAWYVIGYYAVADLSHPTAGSVIFFFALPVAMFAALWLSEDLGVLAAILGLGVSWYGIGSFRLSVQSPAAAQGVIAASAIAASFLLARRAPEGLAADDSGVDPRGIWILAAGSLLCLIGFLIDLNPIKAGSIIIVVWGTTRYFFGRRVTRKLAFPIFFLCFMVVVPRALVDKVGFPMQLYGSKHAAAFVNALGITAMSEGTNISLAIPGGDFIVEERCSGIHSMVALVALSSLMAYLLPMPFSRKVILFLCAIPIALIANLIRIILILLVATWWSVDVAQRFFHDYSSPMIFLIALGVLYLVGKVLIWQWKRGQRRRRAPA